MNYSLLVPIALLVLFAAGSWKGVPRRLVPFGVAGFTIAEFTFVQMFFADRAALQPLDIGLFCVAAICMLVALIGTLPQPGFRNNQS